MAWAGDYLWLFCYSRGREPLEEQRCGERSGELGGDEPGYIVGRIPAKVLVRERARVTAGLAKDVDAVNQ